MKDMGEASYVLGVKIVRDRTKRLLGLSQETYIKRMLERYTFLLNDSAILWSSKKQSCVTLSTMEAEYISISLEPVIIFCDNTAALAMAKDP